MRRHIEKMKNIRKIFALTLAFILTMLTIAPYQAGAGFAFAGSETVEQAADESSEADPAGVEDPNVSDKDGDLADPEQVEPGSSGEVVNIEDAEAPKTNIDADDADKEKESDNDGVKESAATAKEPTSQIGFEGKTFDVTIDGIDKAGLPDDTDLSVKEITAKDKEYEEYYEKAVETLQDDASGSDTRAVRFVRLYDMTLISGDEVLEPKANVDVTIDYSKAIEAGKAETAEDKGSVKILHFTENKKGKLQVDILDKKVTETTIEDKALAETKFEAESFSVYAIVYTVDFHYGDGEYDFSIKGESDIMLSEVIERLHMEPLTINDVRDAKFSDPDLVKVEKVGGAVDAENGTVPADDWKLTSLKAFSTDETLTLTLNDGTDVVVKVTDAPAGDAFVDITSDQIKDAVSNSTEVPFYFLLPDGQTIYETEYKIHSGRLNEDRNTVTAALNAMNSALGTNFARTDNNFYYVYDAATDSVDKTSSRGNVFNISGRIYYTRNNETNANLTKAASGNRDSVAANIRNNKSMLLEGDKILIPLKLGRNLSFSYQGVNYTVNAANNSVTATGLDNSYSGTPTIYGEIPYTVGDTTLKFQLSNVNNFTRATTKLDFDSSLIERMYPADVSVPDLVTQYTDEEALLADGYKAGSSNDGAYQVWKKAEYNDGDINITLKYFQKQNVPLDFIFVLDETSTTGTSNGEAHGITAPILFWTRAATLKATEALFEANSTKSYQNRVSVIIWDDTYQYSSGFKTSYNDVKSWMSQNYTNTGTTHHAKAIRAALELAKQSYEADGHRSPVIAYLSDFQAHSSPTYSDMRNFTFEGKTGVASTVMKEYCLSYGLRVLEDNAESAENTPTFSTNGKMYSSNGADTDTLLTAFSEIIHDAVGYISGTTNIEDEMSNGMKSLLSNGATFSSTGDGSAATYSNGTASWPLNNGEIDGVIDRLPSGELITKTLKVTTTGNEVISGAMPTNGDLTVEDRDKELNKISAANSPILKKNVEMVAGVMTETRDQTDRILQGIKFTLSKDGEQVWEGTTNAVGLIRIPYNQVHFEPGDEYVLTQDQSSTPSDKVVIPDPCTWKLTVGNDYKISSEKVGADVDMTVSNGRFRIWNIEQTEHSAPLIEVIVKKVWDGSVPDYEKQDVPFSIYAEKTDGTKVKVPAYSTNNYDTASVITELTSSDTNWSRSVYVPDYIEEAGDLKDDPYTIDEDSLTVKKADSDTVIGQPGEWNEPVSTVIPGETTPGQTTYDIISHHDSGNSLYLAFSTPSLVGYTQDIRWIRAEYTIGGENYRTYIRFEETHASGSLFYISPTYYVPIMTGDILNTGLTISSLKYSTSDNYTDNEPNWEDVSTNYGTSSLRFTSTRPTGIFDEEWSAQKVFTRKEAAGQDVTGADTLQITNSFNPYHKLNISSDWADTTEDAESTNSITKVKYDVTVDGNSVETPEVNKGGILSVYVPAGKSYSVKQAYYKVNGLDGQVDADTDGSFAPFDLTASADSGTFAGDQDTAVTFTNTRKSMNVKVQTNWEPMPASDDPVIDTNIEYALTYIKHDGTNAQIQGENNKSNNWEKEHTGTFPAYSINGDSTDCTISTTSQEQLADYDVTVEREETGLQSVVFTITNTIKNGSIVISKVWEDGVHGEQDAVRPDEVTVHVAGGNNVNKTVTLKASSRWSETIDLPINQTYTITEDVPDQYVARYEGGTGDDNNQVALTTAGAITKVINKYDPYVLTVSNIEVGEYADLTKEFEFTISGLSEGTKVFWNKQEKPSETGEYADLENNTSGFLTADENGEITIVLNHLQKVDLNVPTNLDGLTLKQEEYSGYITKMDGSNTNSKTIGKLTANKTVDVVNEFKDGDVVPTGFSLNNWTGRMVFLLVAMILAANVVLIVRRRRRA